MKGGCNQATAFSLSRLIVDRQSGFSSLLQGQESHTGIGGITPKIFGKNDNANLPVHQPAKIFSRFLGLA